MSKRTQRALRHVVQRATVPTITVAEIASASHLSPATISKFIRGGELTADQEQRVKAAVLWLLPSEGKR